MATANIWNIPSATTVAKQATQERYLTAQAAAGAYKDYYGYIFYTGDTMEVSEENGWKIMDNQYPLFMTEEEGWTYDEAVKIDQELFWDNLITSYQGYAY